ncbi:MAG TPA: GlsB/YeaQ/YmgE family stress response membrane protein [Paracoccus sp. (in: a-proteobacteria)]|nr:GlsB/YeaQ/YmgE family stress response membrane protein [Paracoccus sp. (in: a-proteobacteria)]
MGLILVCAIVGAITGWMMADRLDRGPVEAAVVGALGGAAGGLGFWVMIGLLGLLAGVMGAVAGAMALLWLYDRWRRD